VIVVSDLYNLSELPASDRPTDHQDFQLEDFLQDGNGHEVSTAKIARHLDDFNRHWLLIDLARHDQATCDEFIVKLSQYCFVSPTLRDCGLVFTTSAMHLGATAQVINESFNCLPACDPARANASQVSALFLRIYLEKLLHGSPLLQRMARRMYKLAHLIYRRLWRLS
jgi:hypothetical protein